MNLLFLENPLMKVISLIRFLMALARNSKELLTQLMLVKRLSPLMKFMKNSSTRRCLSNNNKHHHHPFRPLPIWLINTTINLGHHLLLLDFLPQSPFTVKDNNPTLLVMIDLHHNHILCIAKDVVLKDTLSSDAPFFDLSLPNPHWLHRQHVYRHYVLFLHGNSV